MNLSRLPVIVALGFAVWSCKSQKPAGPSSAGVEVADEVIEIYYNAEAAFQAGNLTEAQNLFTEFVKKSPLPAPGYYRLACLSRNAGKNDEALEWVIKAEKADTTNYHYPLFEADLYQRSRQYMKAGMIYEQLARKYPDRWSFFTDAARMYKYSGDYNMVLRICEPWEKAFGLREDIATAQSEAFLQLKRYDEGFTVWMRLIDRYPYRKQYKLTYASMLSRAGRTDSAASVYKGLLKEDPENPDILSSLCNYYQTAGDRKKLWEHSKLVVNSEQMDVWKKHSCLVPFLNDLDGNTYYDSLEAPLRTLTRLHASDHRSWLFLADWYFARKQYLQAIDGFSRTLSLFSNDFRIWSKYTECLDRTGNYQRLTRVADSMVELFPSNPTVELIAVNGYMGTGDWAKAEEHCQTALIYAVDEDIVVALKLSLARVLTSSGKMNDAIEIYSELRRNYPENSEVMNGHARFLALHQNKPEDGLTLVGYAIAITPKADYYYTRGEILGTMEGKKNDAIADLEKAISLDRQGKYRLLLGNILYATGKITEAQQQWKLAWDEGYRVKELQNKLIKATP